MINPKDVADEGFLMRAPPPEMRVEWRVPAGLAYFDGHFPGRPTLPAVAMIDLTLELVRKWPGAARAELDALKSAKFTAVIGPGADVEIRVTRDDSAPGGARWRGEWSLRSGDAFEPAASFLFSAGEPSD